MKKLFWGLLFSGIALAVYKPGDLVSNHCWKDSKDVTHCLKDTEGKTRVLMYSAIWCAPCNAEMSEMGRAKLKKDVEYLSLLCDGDLTKWDVKHGLSRNGIRVLASPRDCGRNFGGVSIPSVAVVEADGRLRAFQTSPGVAWILKQ